MLSRTRRPVGDSSRIFLLHLACRSRAPFPGGRRRGRKQSGKFGQQVSFKEVFCSREGLAGRKSRGERALEPCAFAAKAQYKLSKWIIRFSFARVIYIRGIVIYVRSSKKSDRDGKFPREHFRGIRGKNRVLTVFAR